MEGREKEGDGERVGDDERMGDGRRDGVKWLAADRCG